MKLPFSMIQSLVETSQSATQIGDLLTMAGFELEGIEEVDGEPVLEIKVMSNRGDGLSALGLAREILAKDSKSKPTDLYEAAIKGFSGSYPQLDDAARIESPECNRFACAVIKNISGGASPKWMGDRLNRCGMRPISLLVDISNYVMLELGQPTHAFDLKKLAGGKILVRGARVGEKLVTLNGEEHELPVGAMMICDAEKPVGVPGVMGGLEAEVSDATTSILLESAHFLNTAVRKTRKQLGLSTEASYRFERSVDREGVLRALYRFIDLLKQSGAKFEVEGIADIYPHPHISKTVSLTATKASKLLGMPISGDEARHYLSRLGFTVGGTDDALEVQTPSWRPDVEQLEDVVEDIGRVHGYENIPEKLPVGSTTRGGTRGIHAFTDKLRESSLRHGFSQTISHTLRDIHALDASGERVKLRNPGSPEMAHLRNSVLPSLADAARRNGYDDLHLFEIGKCFAPGVEEAKVGLLSAGALLTPHWTNGQKVRADFFSLKGTVLSLLQESHLDASVELPKAPDARLHPTRQGVISSGGKAIGVMGQIHPKIAQTLDMPADTQLAEFNLPLAYASAQVGVQLKEISRNPAVRRDIAILVDKAISYTQISKVLGEAVGPVLEDLWLFDVYEGKGIPEGHHSLAIALQMRKVGSNFTDEEANQVRDRGVQALESLGAKLR